jgi:hypothetical protein
LSELYNTVTSNLKVIKQKIELWKKRAMFERSDVKKSLDPKEVNNQLNKRSTIISTESQQILELVHSSVSLLTNDDAEALNSPAPQKYLDYIGKVVSEKFQENILFSFEALLQDLSVQYIEGQSTTYVPLITTRLELIGNAVNFNPPLMEGKDNLYSTFKTWCRKSLELTNLIGVFYEGQNTIFNRVSKSGAIYNIVQKILNAVEGMAKQCTTYKDENFSQYSTVWSQSRESFINEFITTGRPLSEPDKTTGLQTQLPPTLEQFGEQLSKYRISQGNIRLIQDSKSFG